jgi:hypothetical protein
MRAVYSSCRACFHFVSAKDSFKFLGSPVDVNNAYRIVPSVRIFGCRLPFCRRVRGSAAGRAAAFVGAEDPASAAAPGDAEDPPVTESPLPPKLPQHQTEQEQRQRAWDRVAGTAGCRAVAETETEAE